MSRFRHDLDRLAQPPGRIGIAFSGGPDSAALLLLASFAYPGKMMAATVDHGLRAGSAAEAAEAGRVCALLGVDHQILRPDVPIEGNIQSQARKARYALLEAWRRRSGLDWILTAHHVDDQAETLLMRLNRGAGIAGLGGVRAGNQRVLRPLLTWRRAELAEIVALSGIGAADDPSNVDDRFDRARLRRRLAETDWIDPEAVARSAHAAAQANDALDWAADRLFTERCRQTGSDVTINPADLPDELRRRLLLRGLKRIDPSANPRGSQLSRLIETLEAGGFSTLAGVKLSGGACWRLEPAPARRRPG